jgi:hypothetical protein
MATKTHDARHSEETPEGWVTICECGERFGPDPDRMASDALWRAHYDELTPQADRFDAGYEEPEPDATA